MKKIIGVFLIFSFLSVLPVQAEEKRDLNDEIIYDIMIDRFNIGELALSENVRKDDPLAYHGGDLLGITKKLDRIKDLGFTTILLSPIMKNATDGYHGYWIEDFFEIEEQFGTMDDLNKLIEEAHKRDIKVILEFVTNYVAQTHPFVQEDGREEWFVENNVKRIEATEWLGNVAVLNQENDEVKDYLYEVAEFWMKNTKIDGFKLNDIDISSDLFLNEFTHRIHELSSDFYLIGGLSPTADEDHNYIGDNAIQAVDNNKLSTKMNDVFTEADQPISSLFKVWEESANKTNILFVDNKNTARFSNNFAEKGRNVLTTWKLTLAYMYTTPGVPVIFQGSELPMYGPGYQESQMLVQFNSTNPDLEEYHDRISSLRSEFKPLRHGDFEMISSNDGMSLFKRSYEGESIYIAINNDSKDRSIIIDSFDEDKQLRGLLGDNLVRENKNGEFGISIPRESADIFIIEDESGLNWLLISIIFGVFIIFIIFIIFLSLKQKKN